VLQAVDSDRAWQQAISMLRDRFIRVSFEPHHSGLSILDHHWTNHMNQGMIDLIVKPLQRGRDHSSVHCQVY